MSKINKLTYVFLAIILLSYSSGPTQLFVGPNGSDTNENGSIDYPFASLERARQAIIKLKREGDTVYGFHVNLREGTSYLRETFTLTEKDSGEEEFPVVYSSYNHEKVVIHGGKKIGMEKMIDTLAPEVLSRFNSGVRDRIIEIDLFMEGIRDYGQLRPVGFSRAFGPNWAELFVNGNPYRLARWPNDSTIVMGNVIDGGSLPRYDDFSDRGGTFKFNTDCSSSWLSQNDIWISGYFSMGWAEDAVELADIDTINKLFKTKQASIYGFQSGHKYSHWYVYNVLEELDQYKYILVHLAELLPLKVSNRIIG